MNFKSILLTLIAMVAVSVTARAQSLLTDYGSADTQAFTITFESNSGSFVQGLNTGTFSTSGVGSILRGTFANVNLSTVGVPVSLQLNLTFNTSFTGSIDYTIGSGPGTALGYTFTGSGMIGTQTISFLRNAALDSGTVVLSTINRATLTADNPNFTLNTLSAISAIPEPSTYVALVGSVALGVCAVRRRRRN